MTPDISVIVPAKNAGTYLRQCLQSIQDQHYIHNFEVIVLVAASCDDTLKIACEFEAADSRFRVEYYDHSIGKTRRHGISLAKGEWIAFVDADDVIHPWYLLQMFSCTGGSYLPTRHAGPLVVMCDWARTEDELSSCGDWETITGRTALRRLAMGEWFDYTVVWGKLWHRDVFNIYNFPDAGISEEQELVHHIYSSLHLLSTDRDYIVHIKRKLYMWRDNPSSLTNQRFDESRLYHIECGMRRLNFYDSIRDDGIASLMSQRLVLDCMWTQAELQKAGCSADSIYRVKLIRKKTLRRIMRDRLIPLRRKLHLAVVCSTPKFARVFGDSVYDW